MAMVAGVDVVTPPRVFPKYSRLLVDARAPATVLIPNVAAEDMIDIDEAVVTVDNAKRGYGKSFCVH